MVARIVGIGQGGRARVIRRWTVCAWRWRWLVDDPHVYNHVVPEILVAGDEGIALLIFKTDASGTRGTRIEAIEILHSCDYGVSGIVGEYLHTHRQARSILGGLREEELECDALGGRAGRRRHRWVRRSSRAAMAISIDCWRCAHPAVAGASTQGRHCVADGCGRLRRGGAAAVS
jgi:hypothetical protein